MGVFAMKNTDISQISKPSDLLGKEILPESIFESEYGKLKFKAAIVPDFSENKVQLELLTKQFDEIKAFMKEDDLLKKSKIASHLFTEARGFKQSADGYEFDNKNFFITTAQERQMDFRNLLRLGSCSDYLKLEYQCVIAYALNLGLIHLIALWKKMFSIL